MTTWVVTSDRLSRPKGETFTDDEIPSHILATLVAAGHLTQQQTKAATPTAEPKEK